MSEAETYVTKRNPTLEDWLEYNKDYFAVLRGEKPQGPVQFAPLTDMDEYAYEAGMTEEAYFEQIKDRVGPLGRAALSLVFSSMDQAVHVVLTVPET